MNDNIEVEAYEPPATTLPDVAVTCLSHPQTGQVIKVNAAHAWRYREQGWRVATPSAPSASALKAEWESFALSRGFSPEDIAGMTKADLIAALS